MLHLALLLALASPPPPGDLDSLSWLRGCWGASQGDGSEECWLGARGNVMLGVHRDVEGLRVTWEYLRVEQRKAGVVYVASPQGQATQEFQLVEASGTSATFTNPQHDFPQRLTYERKGETLHVTATGVVGGKEKRATWSWQRQAEGPVPRR